MVNTIPYDQTNSSNPFLLNSKRDKVIVDEYGNALTAEYIWERSGQAREDLVQSVFNYYRDHGFPYPLMTDSELDKEFKKLVDKNVNDIVDNNGAIKNSCSIATNITKHFNKEFYAAKGNKRTKSPLEIFNDDDMFLKVLKNRMGYNTTTEGGQGERPYIFSIHDDMILQGMRSSGLAYATSIFKPSIAKFIYSKYCKQGDTVLDYSAGWGARCLGALSLGLNYYGIDPLTHDNNNNIITYFKGNGFVVNGCSEDKNTYNEFCDIKYNNEFCCYMKFNMIFSSPPYWSLEHYSEDDNQSDNKYKTYDEWLNIYWNNTVKNCKEQLHDHGVFGVTIVDAIDTYTIKDDMVKVCESHNLKLKDTYKLLTHTSHLSSKATTKRINKTTEGIYIFER